MVQRLTGVKLPTTHVQRARFSKTMDLAEVLITAHSALASIAPTKEDVNAWRQQRESTEVL